ncbi:hypothetical protein [Pseudoalteromonas sp. BDTF-M6]|uniref:hypothetical protein n=1 Tax=Pseudoalteromonas sp. BDTF-M6 TaxID=2796132 RepID=UPI001BB0B505|nr:hypothetical protein [Pseudoalteromonas sp. BDTF-M6]MBS3796941.1 hypothetical protein [Pseudoalteromonas sp. BDTF-M6]
MLRRQYKHYDCIHINTELDLFIRAQLQACASPMNLEEFYQALAQLNDEFGGRCRACGDNSLTLDALREHYPNAAGVSNTQADILDENNCPIPVSMLLIMLDELGLAPRLGSQEPARVRARQLLQGAIAA